MPDTASKPPKGKDNVLTRKIGPLPTWVWVAIIAAALLLYVTLHKKKSSGKASGSGGGKTGGFGASLVPPVVLHGARGRRGKRGKSGDDDDGEEGEPPEREFLEHWTGSEHPYTYLAQHHDIVEVGPHRTRIIHDGRTDNREHTQASRKKGVGGRPGDEDKAPKQRAARGVPGKGRVQGELVSVTIPESGSAPSLAQVASRYNTAPDAIIEEATGRGNPHGAMWRRYVAANDWQAPLPHGTDMTILAQPA